MFTNRVIAGAATGVLVAAALAVVPAIGAPGGGATPLAKRTATASSRSIGAFTPASADPKLAAIFARAGLDASDFRFTPSETRRAGSHAVTVAVRARSTRSAVDAERVASTTTDSLSTVSLAPIAYNLGVAVGWKRFAVTGEMAHVDLAGAPGSREAVDLGLSYSTRKFSGRVKAAADRPLAGTPPLIEDAPSYSLDVGGSYSLTRNLDVTAGLRYKAERNDRLERLSEDRRDSQAVYIGTAFRF